MLGNPFADERKERAELYRLFGPLPTTEIVGALSAWTPRGLWERDAPLCVLQFELIAWKPQGGALQEGRLYVERQVSEPELADALCQLRTETMCQLIVKIAPGKPLGARRALLLGNLGPAHDDDVMRALREYQQPMSVTVEPFGTFTLQRSIDWLTVWTQWCGRTIELAAEIRRREDAEPAIGTARALWQHMPQWDSRITRYTADHLLAPGNQSCLRESDREVSADELARRLTLHSLVVYPNQKFEAWCGEESGIFHGYLVAVRGSISEGLESAAMIGADPSHRQNAAV